jgi:hypothetical protein
MDWKEKLEYAVRRDVETEPQGIKNFISEENELLDITARKLTFAVHDLGFVTARLIFSRYWVNMTSKVGINDDVAGYYTTLILDRETSTMFNYSFYTVVTENGIICRSSGTVANEGGKSFTDDNLDKQRKKIAALSLDDVRAMENPGSLNTFVDTVMRDYAESYLTFLKTIKDVE